MKGIRGSAACKQCAGLVRPIFAQQQASGTSFPGPPRHTFLLVQQRHSSKASKVEGSSWSALEELMELGQFHNQAIQYTAFPYKMQDRQTASVIDNPSFMGLLRVTCKLL
eukprot:1141031-Pelagomonas_calceolata.AAC.3